MQEKLLTYALRKGKLVNIRDVANGLACSCFCPQCNEPLIAKNNPTNKKIPHFAHNSGADCVGAYETALHLLAKEVIIESKKIKTPAFQRSYSASSKKLFVRDSQEVVFDEVLVEHRIGKGENGLVVADAVGIVNKLNDPRKLIIEFAKTHFVDESKKEKLKRLNLPCIEIDLGFLELDKNILKDFLLSESDKIYWLNNPKLEEQYQLWKVKIAEEKRQKEELRKQREELKQLEELRHEEFLRKRDIEHKNQYDEYQSQGLYKIYTVGHEGFAKVCPKRRDVLAHLRNTPFYSHIVLKQIIDGEYWNGKIYGYYNGCNIYFRNEKIWVYPRFTLSQPPTTEQGRSSSLFYAGLKSISELFGEIDNCQNCEFRIKSLFFNKTSYAVCSHSNKPPN